MKIDFFDVISVVKLFLNFIAIFLVSEKIEFYTTWQIGSSK